MHSTRRYTKAGDYLLKQAIKQYKVQQFPPDKIDTEKEDEKRDSR